MSAIFPEVTTQAPLTRRGTGPGLVLVVPPQVEVDLLNRGVRPHVRGGEPRGQETLDPEPLKKWAEEGYAVAQVTYSSGRDHLISMGWCTPGEYGPGSLGLGELVGRAIEELGKMKECEGVDKVGLVVHGYGDDNFEVLASALAANPCIASCVWYGRFSEATRMEGTSVLILAHIPAPARQRSENDIDMMCGENPENIKYHYYPNVRIRRFFALPSSVGFNPSVVSVAHTRSLTFMKPLLGGPYFDLEAIWDEHTKYEFEDRSVEKTMATMVDQPYVNHVPTLTGGVGRENLTKFYRDHFIHSNAEDAQLELVSRTVGIDRIVDEFLFNFTHDRVVDWLIPGIPPTHREVSIPFTSIVNIRGDRLYHEHIAWDQGTVLRQLGLLPEYLPFPYALPDGRQSGKEGKRFEYRVPVAGVETAKKLVDENAVESNEMLGYQVREVSDE
ncbi:hypothetical protein QBC32DRAFT_27260 [Pseudoneurospora amorphoporcata]|uniref:Carboxymethylenebutenolidase n=1 Tax=Pseudoneurospora amorphoporcata TaxID=241081 RepID=A0AAN6SD39_9PEZI|nr:hypothetical protein QBC32DRAFT_27260 [Pseudoneurospora amorphoporcata]